MKYIPLLVLLCLLDLTEYEPVVRAVLICDVTLSSHRTVTAGNLCSIYIA